MRVRKEYEDRLRRLNKSVGTWLRYAKWEEGQGEVARARSIYERTLDVDPKEPGVWLRYAEMEMRAKYINRARNVLDRATALLPRVEALWFKYAFMEEMLGNVEGARGLFERWMAWEPAERAWLSYANLELRSGSTARARAVYERYVACHPCQAAYLKYARWEARNGQHALARRVLERTLDELRVGERNEELYIYFAKFEQECGEPERARAVFRAGLAALAEGTRGHSEVHTAFLAFEKQHGSRASIEEAIIAKRRGAYEAAVAENPLNYDAWFDWVRLEESEAGAGAGADHRAALLARTRDVFQRAVANVPPIAEKRYWRRYIYLWLGFAVFEELVAKDGARARGVYREALRVVPHRSFTFGKLWLLAAHAEVRAKDLPAARKLLGA
jgi:crooked neck